MRKKLQKIHNPNLKVQMKLQKIKNLEPQMLM